MELERKSFSAVAGSASEAGQIEAVVSVFGNLDKGKDIIRPGAFTGSLGRKFPKGVWQHDWHQPIAKTIEAKELLPGDPLLPTDLKELGGLYIKGQFNLDTQIGKEAHSNIQFGIIDEFSIGYRTVQSSYNEETEVRELLEVELYEWSPVLVGMNPATRLLSIKSNSELPDTLTFAQHSETVLACLDEFCVRAKSIAELRTKDGRSIGQSFRDRVEAIKVKLSDLLILGEEPAAEKAAVSPEAVADQEAVRQLHSEILRSMTARSGALRST